MANEASKPPTAPTPEQPVYPYLFPPPPPGVYPQFFSYPPPNPESSEAGTAPSQGTPYVFPFPPPPGLFYPFPPHAFAPAPSQPQVSSPAPSPIRPKRSQVKMACTNCAAACKRCSDERPCTRCQKYQIQDSCVDGQRKERKKGIKRGPYKRRVKDTDGTTTTTSPSTDEGASTAPESVASPSPAAPPADWAASPGQMQPSNGSSAVPFVFPPSVTPQQLPAPPEGYPQHFYPPMGVFLAPPPPGSNEGTPPTPIPYFYPYPPFGMLPASTGATVPTPGTSGAGKDGMVNTIAGSEAGANSNMPAMNGANGSMNTNGLGSGDAGSGRDAEDADADADGDVDV